MFLDLGRFASLSDEIQVLSCEILEMVTSFVVYGAVPRPNVTVVVVPMRENVVATFVKTLNKGRY
jgi:hypothetical protein